MSNIEYLKRYQAWRTGELDVTMGEAGITPAGLSHAINEVIKDAERYRYLKRYRGHKATGVLIKGILFNGLEDTARTDQAIDAARQDQQ